MIPSIWERKIRFNGFFFGVNVSGIAPVAASFPRALFDPKMVMVGQEDWLSDRLNKLNIMPKISLSVFIFHFKSVTVKAANYKWWQRGPDKRDQLKLVSMECRLKIALIN